MLKKIAPRAKIKRMISSRMGVKRTALAIVDAAAETEIGLINKKKVLDVALKTVQGYQERIEAATDTGVRDQILDDPKQLIQRVQNEVVFQISGEIKGHDGCHPQLMNQIQSIKKIMGKNTSSVRASMVRNLVTGLAASAALKY